MAKKEVNSEVTKAAGREGNGEGELPDEIRSSGPCQAVVVTGCITSPFF